MNEYLEEHDGQRLITAAGEEYLGRRLTSTTSSVYAFIAEADPIMAAAAMARLSRREGDLRHTLLDEFAVEPSKADALIKRVVTAFGDDSVQQLVTIQFVVEGASNLLTKLLEWGRIGAAYLEQSTRYIYFDRKDSNGRYNYYLPEYLPPELRAHYDTTMTQIFEIYSEVVQRIAGHVRQTSPRPDKASDPGGHAGWPAAVRAQACDAARPLLPVATRSTVGFAMTAQALDALIMRLLAEDLPEAQAVGRQILEQTRQIIPAFLERTDREDRGGLMTAYLRNTKAAMQKLATDMLPETADWDNQTVKLTGYWPENELDLAAAMLFDVCGFSESEIRWQLRQQTDLHGIKEQILKAYIGERLNRRHKPGRALEQAHFSWELVGDYGTFRDLQRHRMVDDFRWQRLHPEFGYEVPALVTEASCEDLFRRAFAIAEELYNAIKVAGYPLEVQYATLLGHRMRYRFTTNLRELFHLLELRTSPQGHPGYRKLCLEMYRKLTAVYPRMAAAMRFVNQADNLDELTRLASERSTANKLGVVDSPAD